MTDPATGKLACPNCGSTQWWILHGAKDPPLRWVACNFCRPAKPRNRTLLTFWKRRSSVVSRVSAYTEPE